MFFISVRSLLCAHSMPESQARDFVRSIPAESVAVFKPCLDSTRAEFLAALSGSSSNGTARSNTTVTIVAPKPQLAAVQRTPAMAAANRKGGASKSGASSVSDGLTTVGTASSSSASLSAPGTANSPATSASSRKSSPDSSAASTPVAPRAVKPVKAPAAKVAALAASTAPVAASKNLPPECVLRVAGPSNVSDPLAGVLSDARRGSVKSAISTDFKVNWDAMKRCNGWRCIYWRQSAGIEVYVVPGRDKEPLANLIEVSHLHLRPSVSHVITYSGMLLSSRPLEPRLLARAERAGPAHRRERVPAVRLGAHLGAPHGSGLEAAGGSARRDGVLLL